MSQHVSHRLSSSSSDSACGLTTSFSASLYLNKSVQGSLDASKGQPSLRRYDVRMFARKLSVIPWVHRPTVLENIELVDVAGMQRGCNRSIKLALQCT